MKATIKKLTTNKYLLPVFAVLLFVPGVAHAGPIVNAILGLGDNLLGFFLNITVFIMGYLVALTNYLFTVALKISVVDFALIAELPGVITGWTAARDISNIFFIFILLYTAVAHILGLGGVNIKKQVIRVVIVALLINFSLTATKIVIDAGNVLATFFYNQTNLGEENVSIAEDLGLIKLTGVLGPNTTNTRLGSNTQLDEIPMNTNTVTLGALGAIAVMFVMIFVLGAAALMFLWRVVILIFLMVLSPLAFLASAVPSLEGQFKKWLDKLLSTTFFAPVYMLFFLVSIYFIRGGSDTGGWDWLDNSTGDFFGGALKDVAFFIVGIGLMLVSMFAAQTMGVRFASGAIKSLGKRQAQFGGFLGRNMVARPVNYALNNARVPKRIFGGTRSLGELAGDWSKEKDSPIKRYLGESFGRAQSALTSASFGGAEGGLDASKAARAKALEERYTNLGKFGDESVSRESAKMMKDAEPEILKSIAAEQALELTPDAKKKARAKERNKMALKLIDQGKFFIHPKTGERIPLWDAESKEKLNEFMTDAKIRERVEKRVRADAQVAMDGAAKGKLRSDADKRQKAFASELNQGFVNEYLGGSDAEYMARLSITATEAKVKKRKDIVDNQEERLRILKDKLTDAKNNPIKTEQEKTRSRWHKDRGIAYSHGDPDPTDPALVAEMNNAKNTDAESQRNKIEGYETGIASAESALRAALDAEEAAKRG